jgi:GxxExxY protein
MTAPYCETKSFDDGSSEIIGACIEIHRHLGPGLLESAYEQCLAHEMTLRRIPFVRQVHLPLRYKGMLLDCGYRMDFVVADEIVVELKTVETLLPIHTAQVLTYLKLTGIRTGLLVNFNVSILKNGLRRLTRKENLPGFPSSCETPSTKRVAHSEA